MSTELRTIEQACEEVRIDLQTDITSLCWLRQHVLDSDESLSVEQAVERIKQVLRCLLAEDIEIGDSEEDPKKFIIWRGSIDERVEKAHPLIEAYENILRKSIEVYKENPRKAIDETFEERDYCAFAFWLCYRRNIDEYES